MKALHIASLALVLALSGCSSSPTVEEQGSAIEEQIKLLEYEKCLDLEREKWIAVFRNMNRDADWLSYLEVRLRDEKRSIYWWHLNDCSKYRPSPAEGETKESR